MMTHFSNDPPLSKIGSSLNLSGTLNVNSNLIRSLSNWFKNSINLWYKLNTFGSSSRLLFSQFVCSLHTHFCLLEAVYRRKSAYKLDIFGLSANVHHEVLKSVENYFRYQLIDHLLQLEFYFLGCLLVS